MSEELLPCPFCGRNATLNRAGWAACHQCLFAMPVETWNTRANRWAGAQEEMITEYRITACRNCGYDGEAQDKMLQHMIQNRWARFTDEELLRLYAAPSELVQLGYPVDGKLLLEMETELGRRKKGVWTKEELDQAKEDAKKLADEAGWK